MIIIFGGTTEGRIAAKVLDEAGSVYVELTRQNLSHTRYLLMLKIRLTFHIVTRSVLLILESGKQCEC